MAFKNEETYHRLAMQGNGVAFHLSYEQAVNRWLDRVRGAEIDYPNHIDGKPRLSEERFQDLSPVDERLVVGLFQRGTREDVKEAVRSSGEAYEQWSREDWEDRVRIFEQAASLMRRQKYDLAAAVTLDNGKNRYEAMADVDEAIDFIDFYCDEMRRNHGYERVSNPPYPDEDVRVLLRPYGVWAIICPFNFPLAITTGMTTGVLITGNTGVLKPSTSAPLPVFLFYEILAKAGLPDGVLNFICGSGAEAGDALANSPDVHGVVFTGSLDVGTNIIKASPPDKQRPVIAEMGSKNPIIVSGEADLEAAAQGVLASAFGYSGQKCSACSRAYVHESVYEEFLGLLVKRADRLVIGNPFDQETFVGPVITRAAMDNYLQWVELARRDGRILAGGRRITDGDLSRGYYVAPTIVDGLPDGHPLIMNELFVPILCTMRFATMPEALAKANSTEFGLTAGIFSENEIEIKYFFDNIRSGVVYANRTRGGSTGAMVGGQAFGGWKASGSTGKGTGSTHYLQQFLREQSRTWCH